MSKSRLFVASLAIVAFAVCGQLALAENPHHWHIKVVPAKHSNLMVHSDGAPPVGLVGIEAALTTTAVNAYGADYWPCPGGATTVGSVGNTACPYVLAGSWVTGSPAFTWPLAFTLSGGTITGVGCDQATTAEATYPCGQTETWYEDDTVSAGGWDLTYLLTAKQGANYVADSGVVDFGPNPYYSGATDCPTGPCQIIIYGDQGLGTQGVASGTNNGNCDVNFKYPSQTNPFNFGGLGYFVISQNKHCVDPVATTGTTTEIAFESITALETPHYAVDSSAACLAAGLTNPCYKVTFTSVHSAAQKWNIWLE